MEERKWEELIMDCLVNVIARLEMESMLFDVPFVCKSWYKATLDPLCWQHLDFPKISYSFKSRLVDRYQSEGFKATELIQFAVNRSGGCAVSLVVPRYFTDEAFVCLAEGLFALRFFLGNGPFSLPLRMLWLGNSINMEAILTQVRLHCKNFVGLGISRGFIKEDESLLIVTLLPNIKYLDLRQTDLDREAFVRILKGCKKLTHFDVRDCEGFEGGDEILKLASHIPSFMYGVEEVEEGSSDDEVMNDWFGPPCNIHAGGSENFCLSSLHGPSLTPWKMHTALSK